MSTEVDRLKRKAYLRAWERDGDGENITYWFCEASKDAVLFKTAVEAQNARSILNIGVTIHSFQGGKHTIRNFDVEELAPNHFVIHCTGPFIYQARGAGESAEAPA